MKITHKLSEIFSKECDDRNLSIFMLSKLGNYFSLSANPTNNISNYSGYLFNMHESMFKTIENIYLTIILILWSDYMMDIMRNSRSLKMD